MKPALTQCFIFQAMCYFTQVGASPLSAIQSFVTTKSSTSLTAFFAQPNATMVTTTVLETVIVPVIDVDLPDDTSVTTHTPLETIGGPGIHVDMPSDTSNVNNPYLETIALRNSVPGSRTTSITLHWRYDRPKNTTRNPTEAGITAAIVLPTSLQPVETPIHPPYNLMNNRKLRTMTYSHTNRDTRIVATKYADIKVGVSPVPSDMVDTFIRDPVIPTTSYENIKLSVAPFNMSIPVIPTTSYDDIVLSIGPIMTAAAVAQVKAQGEEIAAANYPQDWENQYIRYLSPRPLTTSTRTYAPGMSPKPIDDRTGLIRNIPLPGLYRPLTNEETIFDMDRIMDLLQPNESDKDDFLPGMYQPPKEYQKEEPKLTSFVTGRRFAVLPTHTPKPMYELPAIFSQTSVRKVPNSLVTSTSSGKKPTPIVTSPYTSPIMSRRKSRFGFMIATKSSLPKTTRPALGKPVYSVPAFLNNVVPSLPDEVDLVDIIHTQVPESAPSHAPAIPQEKKSFFSNQRYAIDMDVLKFLVPVARYGQISQCILGPNSISKEFKCRHGCAQFTDTKLLKLWHDREGLKPYVSGYMAEDAARKWVILAIQDYRFVVWDKIARIRASQSDYVPWDFDKELFNDASFNPVPCGDPTDKTGNMKCKVHAGLMHMYKETMKTIYKDVEAIISDPKFADHKFIIAGHSHAGSIATLVGANLKLRGFDPTVVSFGAPKIGNKPWADWFDKLFDTETYEDQGLEGMRRYFRVTKKQDPWPLLPVGVQYTHPRGEVYITTTDQEPTPKQVLSCKGQENFLCSYSPAPNPVPLYVGSNHWKYFVNFYGCDSTMLGIDKIIAQKDPEDPYSFHYTWEDYLKQKEFEEYGPKGRPILYGPGAINP